MNLLTSLLLMISLGYFLGRYFVKFKQPSIVGEMLAGIILGPVILNLVAKTAAISNIAELAMLFVVISAGLEMNFRGLLSLLKDRGLILAFAGFLIPFVFGYFVGLFFGLDPVKAIFLGVCISITGLPVTLRMLESFGLLKSTVAQYSVATSIITDVAAFMILGLLLDLSSGSSFQTITRSMSISMVKLLIVVLIVLFVHHFLERARTQPFCVKNTMVKYFSPPLAEKSFEFPFTMVIIFVLTFGLIGELLGLHFTIGVFLGALLIDKHYFTPSHYVGLQQTIGSFTNGFLSPIFFASVGLELKLIEISSIDFVMMVILVSIISKVLAGWLGGRLIGLSNKTSLSIGIVLNNRGAMEILIANVAYQKGFIEQEFFSALVLMGITTTIITPILYKRFGENA